MTMGSSSRKLSFMTLAAFTAVGRAGTLHPSWPALALVVRSPPICRYSYGKNGPPKSKSGRDGPSRRGGGRRRPRPPPPPIPPPGADGRGCFRELLPPGTSVWVIQKEHQRSGQLTAGLIGRSLGRQEYHPRGIKVMLQSGIVGRVSKIEGDGGDPDSES